MNHGRGKRRTWLSFIGRIAVGLAVVLAIVTGMVFFKDPVLLNRVKETVTESKINSVEFPELKVTAEEVEGSYYYRTLTEEEQLVYQEMLQGVNEMEECILLHAGKKMDAVRIYKLLLYDRPEVFWCSSGSRMKIYDGYTELYPNYSCTDQVKQERQKEIDAAAEAFLGTVPENASQYDKIRYVYEYIVNTVDYDTESIENQNIYSSLVKKSSVCAGYTRGAQYLLGKLGVESLYVSGNIKGQGSHAWNIVKCDGKYYQMDVTFADPVFTAGGGSEKLPMDVINYDYLCCTDADILIDHVPEAGMDYPVCDSDDLNYYRQAGCYYETYDPEQLLHDMNQSISSKEPYYVCKFAGEEAYIRGRDGVIDDLLPEAAQNLAKMYQLPRVKYTYSENKEHHRITIFWSYEAQ